MQLPTALVITHAAYALDGGTTFISAIDESGAARSVLLVQHAFAQSDPSPQAIPGRLYFDNEIVSIRSPEEEAIVRLLRGAGVRLEQTGGRPGDRIQLSKKALILSEDIKRVLAGSPEQNVLEMVRRAVDFIDSAAYVQFAEKLERARISKQ